MLRHGCCPSSDDLRHLAAGLLASVYGWFNQGFDTPDLVEAKARIGLKNLAYNMRRRVQPERLAEAAPT